MAEKEYIERDAALAFQNEVEPLLCRNVVTHDIMSATKDADMVKYLQSIPAADVRPVVTCAECDWHVDCGYHFCNKWCLPCPDNADFYCAYGERPTAGLT